MSHTDARYRSEEIAPTAVNLGKICPIQSTNSIKDYKDLSSRVQGIVGGANRICQSDYKDLQLDLRERSSII